MRHRDEIILRKVISEIIIKDGRVLCISADREIYDTKYLQYYMRLKTEMDILTPPKVIQQQFAAFVHQTDKLKVVY